MATKVIARESSKHTFATLWKHAKCILRMHIGGILEEAETTNRTPPRGIPATSAPLLRDKVLCLRSFHERLRPELFKRRR